MKENLLQEQFLLAELARLSQELDQLKQELQNKTQQLDQVEDLREKERLLQLVLDNIPQLIFWKDRNSVFQGCNKIWAKAAGLNHPDNVIGQIDYDLYPNATDVEKYIKKDRQVIMTGQPEYHLEYNPNKDVWFDTKKIPIQDFDGNIVGILATIEDITQRQKAEEALRIAEENYRGIFENALEGIFQSTPDGHFINVNLAMARIYGYESPAEMIASVKEISHLYVDPSCREQFNRLIAEPGQVKGFEYQVYRQDKSIIWVEESTRAICDSKGQVLHYEGIIQDLTERKRKESALQQQIQDLRKAIDIAKQDKEVAEIVETDSFQTLKQKLQQAKKSRQNRK